MPARTTAIVTALILERPMCIRCIATKAGMSLADLDTTLAVIAGVLTLHRTTDRCHVCGISDTVLSVERPGQ